MARLILARHGETSWNLEKVFRGRADVSLNEIGIEQAELLGKYRSNCRLEAVHSSPIKRLDTANIAARYQEVGVCTAEGPTAFDFGKWQSLPERKVKRSYPAVLNEWHNSPDKVRIPGGESLEDVRRRAVEVVNDVPSRHQGNLLLASHRVVIKVLICYMLGLDNSHFRNVNQDVGGITTFDYTDGRFILTRHNDTSHLRQLQASVLGDICASSAASPVTGP